MQVKTWMESIIPLTLTNFKLFLQHSKCYFFQNLTHRKNGRNLPKADKIHVWINHFWESLWPVKQRETELILYNLRTFHGSKRGPSFNFIGKCSPVMQNKVLLGWRSWTFKNVENCWSWWGNIIKTCTGWIAIFSPLRRATKWPKTNSQSFSFKFPTLFLKKTGVWATPTLTCTFILPIHFLTSLHTKTHQP